MIQTFHSAVLQRKRAGGGGGGGAVWYDTVDFGGSLSSSDQDGAFQAQTKAKDDASPLVLPAGTITKLRFKTGTTDNSANTMKAALYASSGAVAGNKTYYPNVTVTAHTPNTIYELILSTPVVTAGGTFYIAHQAVGFSLAYSAAGGVSELASNQTPFPSDSLDAPLPGGPYAITYAFGVYVEP